MCSPVNPPGASAAATRQQSPTTWSTFRWPRTSPGRALPTRAPGGASESSSPPPTTPPPTAGTSSSTTLPSPPTCPSAGRRQPGRARRFHNAQTLVRVFIRVRRGETAGRYHVLALSSKEGRTMRRTPLAAAALVSVSFAGAALAQTAVIADYTSEFAYPTPTPGWSYRWNANGPIGTATNYVDLVDDFTAIQRYEAIDNDLYPEPPGPAGSTAATSTTLTPGRG